MTSSTLITTRAWIASLDRPGSERRPEAVFFLCALIFGLASLFITPPFQSPDEYSHFFRAYYAANGGLIGSPTALSVPDSLLDLARSYSRFYLPFHPERQINHIGLLAQLSRPFHAQPTSPYNINNTIFYPPLAYFPQSLGVRVGLSLALAPLSIFYIGRLFNLLLWIFLVMAAIRTTPVHKWVVVMLALMPMTLFLAASTSPDALLSGLCFLFVAYFLRLLCVGEPITNQQVAVILALAAMITLTKHIYGLIAGIYLLMPAARFGSRRRYLLVNGLLVGLVGTIGISWYSFVSPMFIPDHHGAVPQAQLDSVRIAPQTFLVLLFQGIQESMQQWLPYFTGVLGWLDTMLPGYVYLTYLPLTICAALVDSSRSLNLPPVRRLGLFGIFAGFGLLIVVSMYALWTPRGAQQIAGVQARYFIPFIWLLLLQFYSQRLCWLRPLLNVLVFPYLLVALCGMMFGLVQRYYF